MLAEVDDHLRRLWWDVVVGEAPAAVEIGRIGGAVG